MARSKERNTLTTTAKTVNDNQGLEPKEVASSTTVESEAQPIVEHEPITQDSTTTVEVEIVRGNSQVTAFSPVWIWRIDERVTEFG